jgi:hypothetical protein
MTAKRICNTRKIVTVSAMLGALLLGPIALSAQVTVDIENQFPNVGVIMVWIVDEAGKPVQLIGFASGTLIRDRVMVTAGHFTAPATALGGVLPPFIRLFASFSPTDARDPTTWIPVVAQATHPSMPFCPPPPQCDPTDEILVVPLQPGIADVGLIFLEHEPQGIEPARLAHPGTLEGPKTAEVPMIIVGYGTTAPAHGDFSAWDGKRRVRISTLRSVVDETWAIWSLPSYVCSGDSGSAIFLNTHPNERKKGERLVANVSDGGRDCLSHNNNNRLDTASVQKWIRDTIKEQLGED